MSCWSRSEPPDPAPQECLERICAPQRRTAAKRPDGRRDMLRKTLGFAVVLTLSFVFLARPAEAFRQPVTVVDRTALTFTYIPITNTAGGGKSEFDVGLSYALGPTWDLLLSYSSQIGATPGSAFRGGARYHLPPPNPDLDVYLTAQYANEDTGVPTTGFLVGAGFTQQLAPTLKVYSAFAYHSQMNFGLFDFGVQYQISRQLAVVVGISSGSDVLLGTIPQVRDYFGLNYTLFSR